MLPTLRDLCRSLGADLVPVTPAAAPAAEVSAVHISELADLTGYLDGGELLLTTGLGFGGGTEWFDGYVGRLAAAGVAGLAIGLGPVYTEIPAELPPAAERAGVPLLVVPEETPFLAVSRRYWSAIAESGQRELTQLLSTHRALVAAALGDSPAGAVVRRLSVAIGGWAAHLGPDGRLRSVWPPERRAAAGRLRTAVGELQDAGAPTSLSLPLGADDVVVQPIGGDRQLGFLAVGHPRPLPRRAQQLTMTAVALLAVESAHVGRLRAQARRAEDTVLELLARGHTEAAREAAAFLGIELPGNVQAAVLTGAAPAELLDAAEGDNVLLSGAAGDSCRLALREADAGWWARVAAVRGARGAVSPAAALDRFGEALRQAEAAAADAAPGEFTDLAADDPAPFDTPRLRAWARRRLAPLTEQPGGELTATLAASLRGRSEQEAARDLGVHRHTVRNRMARVEALLGVRLADPDARAELWLALRLAGLT